MLTRFETHFEEEFAEYYEPISGFQFNNANKW